MSLTMNASVRFNTTVTGEQEAARKESILYEIVYTRGVNSHETYRRTPTTWRIPRPQTPTTLLLPPANPQPLLKICVSVILIPLLQLVAVRLKQSHWLDGCLSVDQVMVAFDWLLGCDGCWCSLASQIRCEIALRYIVLDRTKAIDAGPTHCRAGAAKNPIQKVHKITCGPKIELCRLSYRILTHS